ncbi:hypothetical protein Pmar_PMAR026407 [Perkinsus marinus ATCC 50983]|uniref:Uncharacterized protein n=1 Tax=Perkinsus marinus (strain ATCC 50983 / TXsc) TaxID=423536 RepID=C5LEN7_PERM5|nr:hypothetical protein Pmar_PMAR026407 [Perkinsus marinus ATCC 50983]EER04855.1 hypothetical protein Pmar_PMAR026407 [Perkinsus marinus ATCC 50983]|eukprot:XP_002773039.1 hypothetical protein Pmar_PMAR026407 [Perkinsus marinus ATCC 50983]
MKDESIRDGTDLCVWEENEDIRCIKGLKFVPFDFYLTPINRMKPPSHIETFGVMDVATGAFLAEANSDRYDFLFNYPGGKVMFLIIDRGSWKAVVIGYDQECGYETVDFPSRYVWEVGYGTPAHEADSQ